MFDSGDRPLARGITRDESLQICGKCPWDDLHGNDWRGCAGSRGRELQTRGKQHLLGHRLS